jgi:hypothetical protein
MNDGVAFIDQLGQQRAIEDGIDHVFELGLGLEMLDVMH